MGILRDNQLLFYADEKYSSVYETFAKLKQEKKFETKHLFILAASIGFKNASRVQLEKRGKETRSTYLTPMEENLLLNLAFTDPELSNELESLIDDDNKGKIKTIIEEYSNGGMKLIVEESLYENWDGYELNQKYEDYYYDLNKFILSQLKMVPF